MGAIIRKTAADLERARQRVAWIDDDDLDDLEPRSRLAAALLGFFTWGGGRLYVGDTLRGAVTLIGLVAWVALSSVVPDAIGSLVFALGGSAAALWSHRGARDVNRFVRTRTELTLTQGPAPATYRLLAQPGAAPPVMVTIAAGTDPPAPSAAHAPLVADLRKLEALRVGGLLTAAEVRDRKIDRFSAAGPATRAELDELLYALMPLKAEGAIDDEDVAFLKRLAGEP